MRKSPATDEQIEALRSMLPPGSKVRCVLRSVSRSGMQREISLFAVLSADDIRDVTYLASRILGDRIGKRGGIVVGGCGMDMGFHLVSTLSYHLYRDGFGCTGEGCPSNDHLNPGERRRDFAPHSSDAPHWHADGDYSLRHEWL